MVEATVILAVKQLLQTLDLKWGGNFEAEALKTVLMEANTLANETRMATAIQA